MVDVIVIGAGVVGCSIARELSRYKLDCLVLEKEADICEGTSKANSGIAHAGYDARPGSQKARFNMEGSRMLPSLAKELAIPYKQNGSLVLGFHNEERTRLEELLERGQKNKVEGLSILSGKEARKKENNLSEEVRYALYAPSGGIVDPFWLTIAMAENASQNGVTFLRNTKVTNVRAVLEEEREQTGDESRKAHYAVQIETSSKETEEVQARAVVNAAGVYADTFHNMVSAHAIHITPRRGQYLLMDKSAGAFVRSTIFQCPTRMGKGVLITPTVHGNLLVGPTAEDIEDKEDLRTTADSLDYALSCAGLSAKSLPVRDVITSFSGLRAHEDGGDFVIGEPADAPFFFDAAGIESPGLTSAPAIGVYLAGEIAGKLLADKKEDFHPHRKGIPCMASASDEEKEMLIRENPLYANVICRCELVSEKEILDAIHSPVGAHTLDGIKRRVRAGMGRCQAGFCLPKQAQILSRELGEDMGSVTKSGEGSEILKGYTK